MGRMGTFEGEKPITQCLSRQIAPRCFTVPKCYNETFLVKTILITFGHVNRSKVPRAQKYPPMSKLATFLDSLRFRYSPIGQVVPRLAGTFLQDWNCRPNKIRLFS